MLLLPGSLLRSPTHTPHDTAPSRPLGLCAGVPAAQIRPTMLPGFQPQPAFGPAPEDPQAQGLCATGLAGKAFRWMALWLHRSLSLWGARPLPPPFVNQKRSREPHEALQAYPAPMPVLGYWGARIPAFGVLVARKKGPGKATKASLASGIPLRISLGVRVPPTQGAGTLSSLSSGARLSSGVFLCRPQASPRPSNTDTGHMSSQLAPDTEICTCPLLLAPWPLFCSPQDPGSGPRAQAPGPLSASRDFRRSLLSATPQ